MQYLVFMVQIYLFKTMRLTDFWNMQLWHTINALKIWTLWAEPVVRNEIWNYTCSTWHRRTSSESNSNKARWLFFISFMCLTLHWKLLSACQDTVESFNPYGPTGASEGTGYVLVLQQLASLFLQNWILSTYLKIDNFSLWVYII